MRITYDPQADALYIQLNAKPLYDTQEVGDSLLVHFNEGGTIAGIELLDVSKHADNVNELTEKYDINKVRAAEARAMTHAK